MVDRRQLLTLTVVAAIVAIGSFSVEQVSAQGNMTEGNMTYGGDNMTDMGGNMTDGSGNVSSLLGGAGL